MKDIIKRVLDRNGIQAEQSAVVDDIVKELTEEGYVHIDSIKLDSERILFCISRIMNELQEERPLIIG